MAAPTSGPCGQWITPEEVVDCAQAEITDAQAQAGIDFAVPILYRMSGEQFPGICERTLRPCYGTGCGCGGEGFEAWPGRSWWWGVEWGSFPSYPFRWDGEWFNSGGCCDGRCHLPYVDVPGPANDPVVTIDGVELDPSAYDVEGFRRIRRLDGGTWPCWQDLSLPSTEPNTWEITYSYGRLPDSAGLAAARVMAAIYGTYLCTGDAACIPDGLRDINREGVSMGFTDPLVIIDSNINAVGIPAVDLWLQSVNRNRLMRRSTLKRLDQRSRNRASTWPP